MFSLASFLFPQSCVSCGSFGVHTFYGVSSYLCDTCFETSFERARLVCPYCYRLSLWGRTHEGCGRALGIDGLFSGLRYQRGIKPLVRGHKYRFVSDIVPFMAEAALRSLYLYPDFKLFLKDHISVVSCVPLHDSRFLIRGYNQAELLAVRIADRLHLPFVDLLERVRDTSPSYLLSKSERDKNVRGAFRYHGSLLKDSAVLLVDDVWTTGLTIKSCAAVLKRSGISSVWGFTFAR